MRRILHLSFGKRGVRKDIDAEFRFHIEMRTREFVALGRDLDEAHEAALAAFGDRSGFAADCRKIRRSYQRRRLGVELLRDVKQDLEFTVRSLKKSPGFTAAILVTLALGIGANAAVFSLVNGVLIQPLPYVDGNDLVHLRQPALGANADDVGFSAVELADYRARTESFESLVEYHSMNFTLLGLDEPQTVSTGVVSAEFFNLLGVEAELGRTFLPGEDQIGAEPVLVLSHEYWQQAFDGDPQVIGRELEMNDRVHTVVGVLPPVPQYPDANDVYMPVSSCPFRSGEDWSTVRDIRAIDVFGRLKRESTLTQAEADLASVADSLHLAYAADYPAAAKFETTAVPLKAELVHSARTRLLVLFGITGFLLLIVVFNVANLTLARLTRREREMAIRSALGAGRARLFRQLLTEGSLLALAGGGIALLLALGGLGLLRTFVARFTTRATEVHIDATVLLFTLAVSLGVGLILGLLPSIPTRARVSDELASGGASATAHRQRLRARSILIASQVAVSFVLLIGAGLFIRSFVKLQQVDPGFSTENLLTVRVPLDWSSYGEAARSRAFAEKLLKRVEAMPVVVSAATANQYPLSGQGTWRDRIVIEGQAVAEEAARPRVELRAVSPSYFATMEIPMISGRRFAAHEPGEFPREAIIGRTLSEHHFGSDDPIGRRICLDDCEDWLTIVGVVGDVKQHGLDSDFGDVVYLPFASAGWRDFRLVARTRAEPLSFAEQVRSLIHELEPTAPVTEVRTIAQARRDSVAAPRVTMLLMGVFGAIALVITATGIGGIIAYSVSQRTREIGIRMALGADAHSLMRMVTRQALTVVAAGLVVGVPAALVLSRFVGGLLYDTAAYDPITFFGTSMLLVLVGVAASFLPAKRATTIDPMMTLRTE